MYFLNTYRTEVVHSCKCNRMIQKGHPELEPFKFFALKIPLNYVDTTSALNAPKYAKK